MPCGVFGCVASRSAKFPNRRQRPARRTPMKNPGTLIDVRKVLGLIQSREDIDPVLRSRLFSAISSVVPGVTRANLPVVAGQILSDRNLILRLSHVVNGNSTATPDR